MSSFSRQPVHQTSRVFVSETSRLAAAIAHYRPLFHSEFARHFGNPRLLKSLTFERRLSLLKKRLHAFVFILAGKAERKEIDFATEALIHI